MRRWVLPAAVAVSIPLAVPTLLRAISVTDWWWLTIAFVGAAVAGLPAALLLDKVKRWHERREEASLKLLAGAVGGGQWLVRDMPGPHVVGTGSADNHPDGPPPYIQRDQHQFVADRLVPGAFVLVVGDVTAGKTRLAYEAVRQKLPDYLLIAPERREFLIAVESAARGRCVLWLDDLERFLGADGLTASAITRMRRGIIVATLRRENLRHLHDAE